MTEPTGAPAFDRGTTWPASYVAHERMMLAQQAKYDRSRVPAVWYWRYLRDEDEGGSAPNEPLRETPRANRRYAEPIAVHLLCDDSALQKAMKKGVVETTGVAKIAWSRAESRRVGAILKAKDFSEGLYVEPAGDFVFVPRPEDVFLYRGEYFYEVQQMDHEFLGLTPIISLWRGTAALLRADSSAPGMPELPPAPTPVPPEIAPWRKAGG